MKTKSNRVKSHIKLKRYRKWYIVGWQVAVTNELSEE